MMGVVIFVSVLVATIPGGFFNPAPLDDITINLNLDQSTKEKPNDHGTSCGIVNGQERSMGDTWKDDCNNCVCTETGIATCTRRFCGSIPKISRYPPPSKLFCNRAQDCHKPGKQCYKYIERCLCKNHKCCDPYGFCPGDFEEDTDTREDQGIAKNDTRGDQDYQAPTDICMKEFYTVQVTNKLKHEICGEVQLEKKPDGKREDLVFCKLKPGETYTSPKKYTRALHKTTAKYQINRFPGEPPETEFCLMYANEKGTCRGNYEVVPIQGQRSTCKVVQK